MSDSPPQAPSGEKGQPYRQPPKAPRPSVGGQAVIEGVMMRSPNSFAVAVRRKAGEIVICEQPWRGTWASRALKVPFVRGAVVLVESMQNGLSALRFSAEQFELDYGEPVKEDAPPSRTSEALGRAAFLGAILFFIALPKLLAALLGWLLNHPLTMGDPRFHLVAGACKLGLFVGYVYLLRKTRDGLRLFQFHGAEHKAIATYEAGEALTVENARRHSTRHARCGTTFMLVVVIVSVAVFALVLPLLLPNSSGLGTLLASIVISIPLMIPIAGVAYELQRLGARFVDHPLARAFLGPGYLIQGLTTAEPSEDQLEIALVALRLALTREAEAEARGPVTAPQVQTFPTFAAFAAQYGGL
ncbi:MAG: DUF1385 domain-containing protein [Deltaproteobacteria bacterium]|nr:DUF1385 domain-containing protein [Deltaproteobacteria bacterium]